MEMVEKVQAETLAASSAHLPREVYLEAKVCGPGRKGDFFVDDKENPAVPIGEVFDAFLKGKENVMLLSGFAGSGKSTAVGKLKIRILERFAARTDGKKVFLLHVSLPKLKNPLSNLFEEGITTVYGSRMRPEQIAELVTLIQEGKVLPVIIADGVDEMPPSYQGKNLWVSNSLEQFRCRIMPTKIATAGIRTEATAAGVIEVSSSATANNGDLENDIADSYESWPKVIFTCRAENLEGQKSYSSWFLPRERDNPAKDEEQEALKYYHESRFVSFSDRRSEYQRKHLAIQLRDVFCTRILSPSQLAAPPERIPNLSEKIISAAIAALEINSPDSLVSELENLVDDCYDVTTVTSSGRSAVPSDSEDFFVSLLQWLNTLEVGISGQTMEGEKGTLKSAFAVLAALFKLPPLSVSQQLVNLIDEILSLRSVWMLADYDAQYEAIAELNVLSSTPFMVQVLTQVLPSIQDKSSVSNAIKNSLFVTLGEALTNLLWGFLSTENILNNIREFEAAFDKLPTDESYKSRMSQLQQIARSVFDFLRKRNSKAGGTSEVLSADVADIIAPLPKDLASLFAAALCRDVSNSSSAAEVSTQTTEAADSTPASTVHSVTALSLQAKVVIELAHKLFVALKRKPTRKYFIYEKFIEHHLDRQVAKISEYNTSLSPAAVRLVGLDYARQLAVLLANINGSKLQKRTRSAISSRAELMDLFFSEEEAWRAGFAAAPVRLEGEFLTFTHKTIQEYFVAEIIISSLIDAVHVSMVSATELEDILSSSIDAGVAATDLSGGDERTITMLRDLKQELKVTEGRLRQDFDDLAAQVAQINVADIFVDVEPIVPEPQEAADNISDEKKLISQSRQKVAISAFVSALRDSPLSRLRLSDDLVVVDFIPDRLLSDANVLRLFRLVYLVECCEIKSKQRAVKELSLVASNLATIFCSKLARLPRGTLLHEAVREEQEVLINFALNIRNSFLPGKGNKLKGIDALDDSKKTAFFYAAERGNNKVCKLLLDAGSNWSLVAQTHPSLAIVHGDNTKLEEFNPQRCSFKSLFSQGFVFACPDIFISEPNFNPETPVSISASVSHFAMYEIYVTSYLEREALSLGWIEATTLSQSLLRCMALATGFLLSASVRQNWIIRIR